MSMKKIKQESDQYDLRAPPRRRQKGNSEDEQPVFLRKAFSMITTCPPEIGGWSEEGDSIVIKDMKAFSEQVIPTAYRHNNFASFVRQLNFYGFRKVRSDSLDKADWWIFRHPHFLRGQSHLISEIKRSVHFSNDNSGNKEVSDLKHQVCTLTERLAALNDQVDKLTSVVSHMHVGDGPVLGTPGPASKKRKAISSAITLLPTVKSESTESTGLEAPEISRQVSFSHFDFDYFMALDGTEVSDENSAMEEDNNDESMSTSFLTESEEVSPKKLLAPSLMKPARDEPMTPGTSAVTAVRELTNIFGQLTPELKERFIDKLAEVMGTQIATKLTAAPAAPVAAVAAAVESGEGLYRQNSLSSQGEYILPSGSKAPEIALPLASAAIGAYLTTLHNLSANLNAATTNAASEHRQFSAETISITA